MRPLLLYMANLFPADPEAVLDTLEVESEQQLRRRIRTGQLPACFDRAALFERARVADPVPQVYRALVFNAMLTGMLSPPTEMALTQEEIARIIERERRSRTTPQFPATPTSRKRRRSKPLRRRLPRGLLEDIFSFFPFED